MKPFNSIRGAIGSHLVMGLAALLCSSAARAGCMYLDFDDDDDPWTIRTVLPEGVTAARARWVFEAPLGPPAGQSFQFLIDEACCEHDSQAFYVTRGNWWEGTVFDPAFVTIDSISSTLCTCCVQWWVYGFIAPNAPIQPGQRYFIGETAWTAHCDDPVCGRAPEFDVEFDFGDGACQDSTTHMAFQCGKTPTTEHSWARVKAVYR